VKPDLHLQADPAAARRWLTLILLLAAALRVFPIWFGLPYPHARPDEETALGLAGAMQGGDLNPHFFHWPTLTIYVFAGLFAIASAVRRMFSLDPSLSFGELAIVARAAIAIAGTLTVFALYRLARRVAGASVALLASLLLAVAILHVRESHFAMTDVLMTLLLTVSLGLLLRAVDSDPSDGRSMRWFAAAGLAGGLATSTKYSAAVVLAAMAAAQIVGLARDPRTIWRPSAWAPSAAFSAAFLAGFVAGTPYAVVDWEKFAADLAFDFTHLSGGHGLDLGRGWWYHAARSLPYGVGVAAFVAALVGILPFVRRYTRAALILGSFVVLFYVSIGSGYTVFFRYVLPLVPLVCLLGAIGILDISQWLTRITGASPRVALALVVALVAGPSLVYSAWFDILLARTDTRLLAAEWLAPHLRAEHSVHDAGSNYTRLDLDRLQFHPWAFDPVTGSFGHPLGHTPDWLVLHESPLHLYASTPAPLRRLVMEKYDLVHTVRGTRGRALSAVYDLQDAFFLPLSRFDTVERPGPTIRIYRRRGEQSSTLRFAPALQAGRLESQVAVVDTARQPGHDRAEKAVVADR
jgi:hypothetical protein